MRCSSANVRWLDLVGIDELRDLVRANKRELLMRRTPGRITPTDVMNLLWHAGFSGLKGGGGAFVQAPVRAMEKIFGAGESTLQESNARLERQGYLESFEQSVDVEWFDQFGNKHIEAEIWAKRRITREGLAELQRQGQLERRVVTTGPQGPARIVVVTGALRRLWKACAGIFRVLARRFAGRSEIQTPSCFAGKDEEEKPSKVRARGRASHFSVHATGPPRSLNAVVAPKGSRAQKGRSFDVELETLLQAGALTAQLAWPDAWRAADDRGQAWLRRLFEPFRVEVTRRFVAAAGPAERAELQRRLAAAAAEQLELEQRPRFFARDRAIAKFDTRVKNFRASVERLGREQGRRR